jgi:Recombinase
MTSATRSACRIFSDCQVVHASSSLSIESSLSLHMSHGQRSDAQPDRDQAARQDAEHERGDGLPVPGAPPRAADAQDFLRRKAARLRDRRSLVRSRNTLGRPRSTRDNVVARIVRERTEGKTAHAIARDLNKDAVPTAQGARAWSLTTVRALLMRGAAATKTYGYGRDAPSTQTTEDASCSAEDG